MSMSPQQSCPVRSNDLPSGIPPVRPLAAASGGGHGPYLRRAELASGLRVAVRPLRPTDRPELAAGFDHLSDTSRYRRFLVPKPRLTGYDLDVLVGTVDQQRHVALVLVWPRRSCEDVIVGVAHAIRLRDDPSTADVAVTVADELQGQGAGRVLMRTLSEVSAQLGVIRFAATMLPSNRASARLLTSLGVVEHDVIETGVRELTVRLSPAAALAS